MKKFILFFSLISSFVYSESEYINSKITFNDGHELNTKILFDTNRYHEVYLDEQSITGLNIKTGDKGIRYENNPSSDIKRVEFIHLQNKPRIFKSNPNFRGLVEVKLEGKISWCRTYSNNTYGSTTQIGDYLQKGDKKFVLNLFSDNKKNLEELTSDKPELASSIDEINYNKFKDEDLLEILKKYNE
ncbi:hypothetical protein [Halpernia sp. GG3]